MPTIVELPDNTELEFPDGMGQMAMQEEIYKAFPKLREPEGLSSPVTPAETLVPESATIQLPSEAMATASVAPTKEELLANEPNLPISEIGAQQATVPRFGEPGTVTRGVSDIIGGFAEWGMNNPEEALAMLTPQGSAALAMRYMPEIGVQFARDSVAALKGDKEALGRSLALLAPVVAHHGWKAVRADWEAPARAKAQADYNALVDDLARQNLSLEKPAEAQTPVEPPMTMAREPGQDVLLPKARDLTEEEAGQVFNLSALDEQLNKEIESAKEVLPQTAKVVEEIVKEPETSKSEDPSRRVGVGDLSKQNATAGYSPLTRKVLLDKSKIAQLSPEERASVVRHELAHKIETEAELWDKTDTYLWDLWEKDRNHPIWDFSGMLTGRVGMRNDVSPEIIAELYAEHYPKGTFTVKERPVPYEWEGEDIQLPKEYPIPKPLMDVLDQIESKLGIWSKKARRTGNVTSKPKPTPAPAVPESVTPVTPEAEPAPVLESQPKVVKLWHAERKVGSVKEGEPLGMWLTDSEEAARNVARSETSLEQGKVSQFETEFRNPLVIKPNPKLSKSGRPWHDAYTADEINQILKDSGVKFKFESDNYNEDIWRFVDEGGTKLANAIRKAGYDALQFPEKLTGINQTSTLLLNHEIKEGKATSKGKAPVESIPRGGKAGKTRTKAGGGKAVAESVPVKTEPTPAATADEPPKPGEIVGMGGAVPSEFEPGGSAAIDIYGIAQRVREARAKVGQVASVEPGQGISAPDSVERGRSLLNRGADPERALRNFEDTKKLSADDMAVVRAQGETLAKSARDIEGKFGTESEEYLRAWKKLSDWDKRTKPMQTEWHKMGEAQQGSTDIDTGSFTGLQRAFRDSTGKDFDAKQAKAAEEHVAAVKKAEAEAAEAKQKLVDLMAKIQEQEKARPKISDYVLKVAQKWVDAWKKEADSARKALAGKFLSPTPEDLLNLAKIARADIAELGLDFAKWTDRMVKEFGPKVQPYLKDAWTKGQQMIEGMLGKIKDKEVQQQVRQTVTKATDPVVDLWRKAKDLIDKGETDPEIVFEKLSVDTGLPIDKIREILTKPKGTKRVSDDMYRKLSDRRRVVQAAKAWLRDQQTPGWLKFMRTVPRAFFIDKVFGHGTVGMITHAGFNMFNPHVWAPYWKAFFQQYPLVFSKAYHERAMLDLTRDPNYVIARRAGLVNDPFKYADDYQNAAMKAFFGKLSRLAGGTGFDALKLFRQARFNQEWNALPDSLQTPQMASLLADSINHATGVVKMPFREWTGWTFFAPKLEGSRWAWMFADTAKAGKILADWKKAAPEERAFAMQVLKERAYVAGAYFGMLALNQGLLKAMGSDQQVNFTNPRQGDFLAFKVAGHKLGVIGPMLGIVRLLANVYHDATASRSNLEKLGSRWGAMGEDAWYYMRAKFSPFTGQVANVVSQADYQQRPLPWSEDRPKKYQLRRGQYQYTYPEYFLQEFTPIPVSDAIREVWASQGMDESAIKTAMKAITVGVVGGGTGARISKDYTVEH